MVVVVILVPSQAAACDNLHLISSLSHESFIFLILNSIEDYMKLSVRRPPCTELSFHSDNILLYIDFSPRHHSKIVTTATSAFISLLFDISLCIYICLYKHYIKTGFQYLCYPKTYSEEICLIFLKYE